MSIKLRFFIFLLIGSYVPCLAQTSSLVSVGTNGKLNYSADSKGNIVPDFSGVGYMNSESAIPTIAVVKTVNPISGDNLTNIQNAINEVAALTPDANGFRGAILFKAGNYNISDMITINTSGIVLRGEGFNGSGTNFIATKTSQYTLFSFAGSTGTSLSNSSIKAVTDTYVPIGAKQVTVANGHTFAVGNDVFIHHIPKQAWVSLLKMDVLSTLPGSNAQTVNWTPSTYDVYYERKVTAVNGNVISFDAPVMDVIDPTYTTAEVVKFNDNRIQKCGIENMRISSTYTSNTDENHGWEAVEFINIKNAWASNLEVYYFGFTAVNVNKNASFITVVNCKMLDAKSQIVGGRRYSFNVDGQRTLVKNCTTRSGRHDYVTGSITLGPNVFYNSTATSQQNNIGPHQRWSTGILFDNITGNGKMDVENRTNSGTGHGWAGSQIMFWNCIGSNMVLQDPPGDHRNWAIGFKGTITNVGFNATEPIGIQESTGTFIASIPSLFMAQLSERLASLSIPTNSEVTFNSSTTWTCPTGITSIDVECWGAGGSGGSATATLGRAGGGGGGGSYVKSTINVVPGTVYTITVGAGGTAGATLSANCSGKQGEKSEFSGPSIITITASGGAAGTGANSHNGGGVGGVLGGVYGINITNVGSGYATAPTAFISGGGGTGADSKISISTGALSFITALNQGSGYSSIPFVTLPGNGTAVALISLDADAGTIVTKGANGNNAIFNLSSGAGGDGANGGSGGDALTIESIGLAGAFPGGGGSGGYSSGVSKVGGAGANGQVKISYSSTLPVSLTSFTAQKQNSEVNLKWNTTSEQNNSHFDVEKSTDGKLFYIIGKVNGAGTSNSSINYFFTDKNPIFGTNYYRLNQLDFDGTSTKSATIAVNFSTISTPSIYPNPTSSEVNINNLIKGDSLTVTDLSGKTLQSKIAIDQSAFKISLANYNNGLYFITINRGGLTISSNKVVKE